MSKLLTEVVVGKASCLVLANFSLDWVGCNLCGDIRVRAWHCGISKIAQLGNFFFLGDTFYILLST